MAAVTEARQVGILQAGALPSHSFPRTPPDPGTDSHVSPAPPPPMNEHYNPPRNGISISNLEKREVELPAPGLGAGLS